VTDARQARRRAPGPPGPGCSAFLPHSPWTRPS